MKYVFEVFAFIQSYEIDELNAYFKNHKFGRWHLFKEDDRVFCITEEYFDGLLSMDARRRSLERSFMADLLFMLKEIAHDAD